MFKCASACVVVAISLCCCTPPEPVTSRSADSVSGTPASGMPTYGVAALLAAGARPTDSSDASRVAVERWIEAYGARWRDSTSADSVVSLIAKDMQHARVLMVGGELRPASIELRFKLSLIRRLHEQYGFNVIALEGPPLTCGRDAIDNLSMSAEQFIDCANGNTRHEDWQAIVRYVERTRHTARPLIVAGIGRHASLAPFREFDARGYRSLVPADNEPLRALATRVDDIIRSINPRWDMRERTNSALVKYDTRASLVLDSLRRHFESSRDANRTGTALWARYALATSSLQANADLMRQAPDANRSMQRAASAASARLLRFVMDTLYPTQRVIVLTYNQNAQRGNVAAVRAGAPTLLAGYMDGTAIGDRMATLGVYQSGLFPSSRSIDAESPWLTAVVNASVRGSTYLRTWFDNADWLRQPMPMTPGGLVGDQVVPAVDYSGMVVLAAKPPD